MKQRFADRIAVVTGGGSGIGKAVVAQLIEEGATVYSLDVHEQQGIVSPQCIPVRIDIADVQAVKDWAATLDRVDHLVNAAGVIRSRPIERITEEEWDTVFGVNTRGLFFVIQALAPLLTPQTGSVVNVSSVGAISAVNTDAADYHASKTAVLSITRSWARALAQSGIRVNSMLPGLTETPLLRGAYVSKGAGDGALEEQYAGVPLQRAATPEEISRSIVFMLSSDAAYMTGASMNVSGGAVIV